MVDTPTPIAVAPATPKKSSKAKKETKAAGKPKAKASHPPTAVMVNSAVKELKERGGSSLHAIKKYIASTYKVDAEKLAPFIRKAIKNSVASGAIVQTKGKGASGSFKIAGVDKVKKPATKPKVAKPKTAAAKKSPAAEKVAKPKKSPAKKAAAKPKSPSKAKKTTKVPTKKPKSPKAKTTKTAVRSTRKK